MKDIKTKDPRKYGFDYGMGGPIVFDSNLFRECPFCKGKGKTQDEKCLVCDGTGAVPKNYNIDSVLLSR